MKQKKIPQRMCVGCQEMKNKKEMIRVVRSPNGEISIDATGKKPGRGAYICSSKECFAQAYKQKRLEMSSWYMMHIRKTLCLHQRMV